MVPRVIRLNFYDKVPRLTLRFNRRNLWWSGTTLVDAKSRQRSGYQSVEPWQSHFCSCSEFDFTKRENVWSPDFCRENTIRSTSSKSPSLMNRFSGHLKKFRPWSVSPVRVACPCRITVTINSICEFELDFRVFSRQFRVYLTLNFAITNIRGAGNVL